MAYKLSILLPSKRTENRERFLFLLKQKSAHWDKIQIVILVDSDEGIPEHVEFHGNIVEIHYPKQIPLVLGKLLEECYRVSKGEWIFFCNDDLIPKTKDWDDVLFENIDRFAKDGVGLFWPNDELFGPMLSCFPIVSRKVLDAIDFFPIGYQRYKIDDTLFHSFPPNKRYFLSEVIFQHENVVEGKPEHGFMLPDGRIYPVEKEAAEHDSKLWQELGGRRTEQRKIVHSLCGIKVPPKVLIGVPTAEYSKRADFYDYLDLLHKPPDTFVSKAHGQSPAKNRNLIIEHALAEGFSHILFLDDDTAFRPDTLMRLLAHDKEIVSGLYLMRNFPHQAIVFGEAVEGGGCKYLGLNGQTGLVPIVAAGLGCILIKTEVFRRMRKPWIRLGEFPQDCDNWCDDIGFFNRVREVCTDIWCDLDILVGHMASVTIWPDRREGKWFTVYESHGQAGIAVERTQ